MILCWSVAARFVAGVARDCRSATLKTLRKFLAPLKIVPSLNAVERSADRLDLPVEIGMPA
jgi:hypothetical protein